MTHLSLTDEQETLVALYALGSLPADEARAFERHLTDDGCAVCRTELAAMNDVCRGLAVAPAPAPPAPAVRSRVLAAAAADRPLEPVPAGLAFAFAADGGWIELKPGVFSKELMRASSGDRSRSYLVRMEPGTVLDRHDHDHVEHCYVVSGSTIVHGRRMRPGDYSYAGRGTVHEAIPSDEGALLFIVEAP